MFSVHGCSVYMDVCVSLKCLVSEETRKHQAFWNWGYRWS